MVAPCQLSGAVPVASGTIINELCFEDLSNFCKIAFGGFQFRPREDLIKIFWNEVLLKAGRNLANQVSHVTTFCSSNWSIPALCKN